MTVSRRRLLQSAGILFCAAGSAIWSRPARCTDLAPAGAAATVKRIAFNHLHTGEALEVEFWRGGAFVPDALAQIEVLLRDFRNGERHAIDPALIGNIHDLACDVGAEPVFSVISGYRSAQTNEALRARSRGVAAHSLHLEGRAIDVRLAGVDCRTLAAAAAGLGRGGVGYYRASDFVHLDTGVPRTWRG
jgi:uncharacterized protein YcbK (DUF882 family)